MIISAVAFVFIYIAMLHINIVINVDKEAPQNADYVLILGARVIGEKPSELLQERIDTAAEYLKETKDTIAIASGGQGPDEGISEALAIKNGLIEKGIEEERIILEEKSSRTIENVKFSKEIMEQYDGEGIIISNYFHIYRAKMIAEDFGFTLYSIPADTPNNVAVKYYVREYLAITKYFLEKVGFIHD